MEGSPTYFEALQHAVDIAGSQSAIARICHCSQTAVWKWLQSSKRLPAEHVLAVEDATGVSRHLLRPDIYPLDPGSPVPSLPEIPAFSAPVSCDSHPISHRKVARCGP